MSKLFIFSLLLVALTTVTAYNDPPLVLDQNYTSATFSLDGHNFAIASSGPYVYQWNGLCLYRYDITATLPVSSSVVGCNSVIGGANYFDITVSQQGRMYHSLGYEMDKTTGQVIGPKAYNGIVDPRGVAFDPRAGRDLLYVATGESAAQGSGGRVYIVRGADARGSLTLLATGWSPANLGLIDGLIVGPDGTVYAAGYARNKVYILYPDDDVSNGGGQMKRILDFPCQPDGMAVSSNGKYLVVACTNGHIHEVELTSGNYAYHLIVNTGTYNDFATVASDGCLYGSTNGAPIYKIGPCTFAPSAGNMNDGGCPGCSAMQTVTLCSRPSDASSTLEGSASTVGTCISVKVNVPENPAPCV